MSLVEWTSRNHRMNDVRFWHGTRRVLNIIICAAHAPMAQHELMINVKAAQALGLNVRTHLQQIADEVIE